MIRCFVTGDNHFGKQETTFMEARQAIIDARMDSFKKMVQHANEEECDLFFITGDLFDKTTTKQIGGGDEQSGERLIREVIDAVGRFHGTVVIIPGNHDYYDKSSTVWSYFINQSSGYSNILILNRFEKVSLTVKGTNVVVYPAYCQSEWSEPNVNNLDWIKAETINTENTINIGLAHGSVEGTTKDAEGRYFPMGVEELEDIGVDVWFIGHCHVPFPNYLKEDSMTPNVKIYNAGTHQPTHRANDTDGYGFIVEIEKDGKKAEINARKWKSGTIAFRNIEVTTAAKSTDELRQTLQAEIEKKCEGLDRDKTVIHVEFKGAVKAEEYEQREDINRKHQKRIP